MGQPLKIAYLHYHLKPGGVTTVIKHQVEAVKAHCQTLVLASRAANDVNIIGTQIQPTPLVAYDQEITRPFTPRDLADQLQQAIEKTWPGGCDVLHVHNPTLAKNKHFLHALEILRERGFQMFLQIHDFAEDGRPDVYCGATPTEKVHGSPYTENVHYGVINSRDYEILLNAGLKKEGLHNIPNKISPHHPITSSSPTGMILYPVRAIRRKNIGESILLSLFLKENQTIGITLPPGNPTTRTGYQRWKSFLKQCPFNVRLDVGLYTDFQKLVNQALFFITTSINEGFGFAFLEPWTAGKMVFGRNLPHVCRDFQRQGVKLDHLYHRFDIPLETIEGAHEKSFYQRWLESYLHHAYSFGLEPDQRVVESAYQAMTKTGTIDFGVLDETAQMQAILAINQGENYRSQVKELNPWLLHFNREPDHELIDHNNQLVRRTYGNENYRRTLLDIYKKVSSQPVVQCIDPLSLLTSFVKPERFKMLQWKEV